MTSNKEDDAAIKAQESRVRRKAVSGLGWRNRATATRTRSGMAATC